MKKAILFSVFFFVFASVLPAAEETLQSKQIANCDRIGYPEWRDDCYESLGASVINYAVCVKFTNKERRDACISNHPPRSADDCLLNKSDKKAQNICLESFGQSPKAHVNKKASKASTQPPARKIVQNTAVKQNSDKTAKIQRAKEEKQAHALEKAIKLQAANDAREAKAQERTAKIEAAKNEQAQMKAAKIQKAKDEKEAKAQTASAKIDAAKADREAKAQARAAKLQAEKDARAERAQEAAAKLQAAKDAKAQQKAERLQNEKDAREAKAQNKIKKTQEITSNPIPTEPLQEKTNTAEQEMMTPAPVLEEKPAEIAEPVAEQKPADLYIETKTDEPAQKLVSEEKPADAIMPAPEVKTEEASSATTEQSIVPVPEPSASEEKTIPETAAKTKAQEKAEKLEKAKQQREAQAKERSERLQKAKEERETQAKEKAEKLKAAKEAAEKEKTEKIQKAKDAKEAAAKQQAERLQKLKEEKEASARTKQERLQKEKEARLAAKKTPVKVPPSGKPSAEQPKAVETVFPSTAANPAVSGCKTGFGSPSEPPQNKKDEAACDKANIEQFATLLNRCMAADHDINILSFDMNKDGCVTCADLKFWQKQANKLFSAKQRSNDGRNLKLKECLERKF